MKKKSPSRLSSILLEAADGVLKIINAKMEEAIKAVSSARGYDIRDFTLVAFGGGGPMHAGRMALDLGIPSVLDSAHAGRAFGPRFVNVGRQA